MILKNGKRIDGCSDTVPIGSINPYLGTTPPFGYLLLDGSYVSKVTYPELYAICGTTFGPETDTEFKLPDLRGVTIAGYKEGDSLFGTLGGLIGTLTHKHSTQGHILTLSEIPEHTHSYDHVNTATESHTLTIDEMPSHSHQPNTGSYFTLQGDWNGGSKDPHAAGSGVWSGAYSQWTSSAGGGQGHGHSIKTYSTNTGKTGSSTPSHNHGETTEQSSIQPTITLNWIVKAVMLIPVQASVVNTAISSTTNVYCTDYINNNIYTKEQSDNRYYTKSEIDALLANYLPLTGGTINGNINVTGNYQVNGTPVIWEEEE